MRLAERRGLLTGSNLSIVQVQAVEMLLLIDRREKVKDFAETFRMRLATSHPQFAGDLYPEWKKPEVTADPESIEAQKSIVWSVPQSEQEEAELMAWVNSRMSGQISASDLEDGGWL